MAQAHPMEFVYSFWTGRVADKKKIQNMSLYTIKRLIDSFVIKNESFINNNYSANFTVNFNKVNTLNYFEKKHKMKILV